MTTPAKKKPKASSQPDLPEDFFLRMLSSYKRKCEQSGILANESLKFMLELAIQTNKLQNIKIQQQIGPVQMRILMQVFIQNKYNRIKKIQVWKGDIGDEGVRSVCRFVENGGGSIEVLDILECGISELGCEFLGKMFMVNFMSQIKKLKLDDNFIGNKGVQNLSYGLRTNSVMTKLSMKYCKIDKNGIPFIQSILANINTKIRSIKLQGNQLLNQGVFAFLKAVQSNEMLQKINIADTGLNLLDFQAVSMQVREDGNQQFGDKEEEQEDDEEDKQNPQKIQKLQTNSNQNNNVQASNVKNVKQTVIAEQLMQKLNLEQLPKFKHLSKRQKITPKLYKTISNNDKSPSANLLRLLCSIMKQNMLIKKYDLRFNPISDDAAYILFQMIQRNCMIKDVEMNNNVDSTLRENLDTLMRKRTGRMPKRKGRGKTLKKKK